MILYLTLSVLCGIFFVFFSSFFITLVQECCNSPLGKKGLYHHHKREEIKGRFAIVIATTAPLSVLTLTLKQEWPHHMFSQIFINYVILTLPDNFFFFVGTQFCLGLWFCALVIWPSRLYSYCEAEEQKDGSNSFCAMPQARLFFPFCPLPPDQTPHLSRTPLPSALAQTHRTPGGWG